MSYILFMDGQETVIQEMTGVSIQLKDDGYTISPPNGVPWHAVDYIETTDTLVRALEWQSEMETTSPPRPRSEPCAAPEDVTEPV